MQSAVVQANMERLQVAVTRARSRDENEIRFRMVMEPVNINICRFHIF